MLLFEPTSSVSSNYSNLAYGTSVNRDSVLAVAKVETAVATFFSSIATARDDFLHTTGWALGSVGNDCHFRTE